MEELLALLGLGGGGLLVGDAYDRLGNIGDTAWDRSKNIGQQALTGSNFQGYGVTAPSGTTTIDNSGNMNMGLTPQQQHFADFYRNLSTAHAGPDGALGTYGHNALGASQNMFGQITGSPAAREQDIYGRIRAMQMPEEQRAQLALESRLAAQGRTGVTTGMYGGTPEQLAMQKAIQEGQNQASVQAIDLARQQQGQSTQSMQALGQMGGSTLGQQGQLAQLYGMLQYAPQSANLDAFNAGSQAYGYKDIAQRQGTALNTEAQMGGLEALLGSRMGQANLMGEVGSAAIGGGMGMLSSAINGGTSSFLDLLKKAWGGVTGN